VIAEWLKNLHHLKINELIKPNINPNKREKNPSFKKSPNISKAKKASKLISVAEYYLKVLNKIIETISLKTPSP
jgi:hypothetical protein